MSDLTHYDGADLDGIGGPACGAPSDAQVSLDWALVGCPACQKERP